MTHKVSVIGLGGMGQTMIERMSKFQGFDVVCGWDLSETAKRQTAHRYPEMAMTSTLEEAVGHKDSNVVYIATPPATHAEISTLAFESGKAVLCEKPLGVDIAASEKLVSIADESGLANVVNFSMASTAATRAAENWLRSGMRAQVERIELSVRFSQWPRKWQMGANEWLSGRDQGGFVREVVSHWVYLTQRLFGNIEVSASTIVYPDERSSESHVHAILDSGGIPVTIVGDIGGTGPDVVDFTIWGAEESARISQWHRFAVTDGQAWQVDDTTTRNPGETNNSMQLTNTAAAFSGTENSMPNFGSALSVQKVIESILER